MFGLTTRCVFVFFYFCVILVKCSFNLNKALTNINIKFFFKWNNKKIYIKLTTSPTNKQTKLQTIIILTLNGIFLNESNRIEKKFNDKKTLINKKLTLNM